MVQAILGKKVGMTQVYDEAGVIHPVTVVQAGPCSILQVKTMETDGYHAVQLGFDDIKPKRARKPDIGHAAKANVGAKRYVREVRLGAPASDLPSGQAVTVEVFEGVDLVDVVGVSKGKGTQGVMKRHHFKGMPQSHGTERKHRSPGSISAHATNRGFGGDIKKGKRMGGRMGMARSTSLNHRIIRIDKENNLLLIKGSLPGAVGGYLTIRASRSPKLNKQASA